MGWVAHVYKWVTGIVVAGGVIVWLCALLFYNVKPWIDHDDLREEPLEDVRKHSTNLLTATGANQRWNMFAPNVGTLSYSPVVVIRFKDGQSICLHSVVEPELPNWDGSGPLPPNATDEERRYSWRFHLGDGRIRKLESKAASSDPGWRLVRANYTRWRAQQWLDANPERRKDVQRIELWRAKIRHPGYGHELHCEGLEQLPVWPPYAESWPVPIDFTYPLYMP